MKLDFSVFSQPLSKQEGHRGTKGTATINAANSVPSLVLPTRDTGDNFSGASDLSRVSPVEAVKGGTESPTIYRGVPTVPLVPPPKVDGCYPKEHLSTLDAPEPEDLLDPLRPLLVQWLDSRLKLDAEGIALCLPPRWSAGVNSLYAEHCSWMFDHHNGIVPPTLTEFRHLLLELCFEIRMFCGEECVLHVALKEDVDAAQFDGLSSL
jgi:hypothetical protein